MIVRYNCWSDKIPKIIISDERSIIPLIVIPLSSIQGFKYSKYFLSFVFIKINEKFKFVKKRKKIVIIGKI